MSGNLITKVGYGQVEPNHLSAQRNGQIYAQLPCNTSINVLENGMFVQYSYKDGEVRLTGGDVEPMLVFNEVKLYDPRHSYKDFAMKKTDFTDGKIYPRVFKTMVGDILTTNLIDCGSQTNFETLAVGNKLTVNTNGILEYDASVNTTEMVWQVVKKYTLADGQKAVKIQRIQ